MTKKVVLDAFEEQNGISLMSGTDVTYENILHAVMEFNMYAAGNKGSDLVGFFDRKHLRNKVIKAFALIGMKHVCDELNRKLKEGESGDK